MAYTKQRAAWQDGEAGGTLIRAADMNGIEQGITDTAVVADAALPKAGGTVTGTVTGSNAKFVAGTTTDVLGSALEVVRNAVTVGRVDNNANGMRVQAQAGSLQLRGSGNSGIDIPASGVADFAAAPTIAGVTLAETIDDRVAALIVAGSGITETYDDVANTLTLSAAGSGPISPIITVGRTRQLGTLFQNAGAFYVGTLGTEYAVGVRMEAQNIDALGHQMNVISTDVTAALLVSLRTLNVDGTVSAPIVQTSFNLNGALSQLNTFAAVAIPKGVLVLTWCRINDTSGTAKSQTTNASSDLVYLASGVGMPAQGHGPGVVSLNTGITAAPIPNTAVTPTAQTTNISVPIPAIAYRRSA